MAYLLTAEVVKVTVVLLGEFEVESSVLGTVIIEGAQAGD